MLKVSVFSFRLREWNCCVQFRIERVNLCVLFQIKGVKCSKFVCSVSDGEWYFGVFSLTLSGVFLWAQFQIERVKRHHGRLDQLFLEESNRRHLRRMLNAEDRTPLVQELRLLLQQAYGDRSEGLAKKLRNKGVNACCWQTGQKDL